MMDYWGLETRPAGEPGINGGLYKRDPNRVIKTFDCTITVENIDKAIADVKANGGTIESMPQGGEKGEIPNVGWFARGIDTEGNIFGLLQPTAWQAK